MIYAMDDEIEIVFLGDVLCQRQQIAAIRRSGRDYGVIFDQIRSVLSSADYVIANLETPVSDCQLCNEEVRFNAPKAFLKALKESGVSCVTVANNHILDCGISGLRKTLDNVESMGMDAVGAYKSKEQSDCVFIKNIKGVRFAFVAATFDTNFVSRRDRLLPSERWMVDYLRCPTPYNIPFHLRTRLFLKRLFPDFVKRLYKKIRRPRNAQPMVDSVSVSEFDKIEHMAFKENLREKIGHAKIDADFVVLLPHMGGQYNDRPGPWQMKMTDLLLEYGADMIVTNHAHTPLQIEVRSGALVAHALGNFTFTPGVGFYNMDCQADYSVILKCHFSKKDISLKRAQFSIVKSVVRDDGVSIVKPTTGSDLKDVAIVFQRVTGRPFDGCVSAYYDL